MSSSKAVESSVGRPAFRAVCGLSSASGNKAVRPSPAPAGSCAAAAGGSATLGAALWAAGAEGVAVGAQRLTVQSAIRSAGDAILVDFRPVSSPYVVSAVGDPARLDADFAASATARRLHSFTSAYGLGFTVRRAERVRLPAAAGLTLRQARPGEAAQ